MIRRRFAALLGAFCLVTLITAASIVAAENKNTDKSLKDKIVIEYDGEVDFYDARMEKAADQSQKDELNKLKNDKTHGIGWYKRDALMITNELAKDQKRLTLEEAEKIVKEKDKPEDIVKAFNEIAGAPDFEGGLGISRSIYYLDDERSKAIVVFGNMLFIYTEYDENREIKINKDLRTGKIIEPSVSPEPSPVKND